MLTLCHIWCKHFLTFYCIFWLVFFVSKLHCSFEFYTVESSSLFAISLKQGGGITIFQDCSLETMGFSGFYVQSCILRRIWRGQGKSTRFPSRLGTSCSTRGGRCGVNDYRGLWEENGWHSAHHKAEYILQLIKPVHSEVMAFIQGERGVTYRDEQESDDGDLDKRVSYLIPWRKAWQPTPVFLPENSMDRETWWVTVHQGSQRLGHDWATNTHTQVCMLPEAPGRDGRSLRTKPRGLVLAVQRSVAAATVEKSFTPEAPSFFFFFS